jgi:hypothetical protein
MEPSQIAGKMSPPYKMVRKYIIASIAGFVTLTLLIFINAGSIQGFYFQPELLGLTHIATLGWITMIIFGAMFQLVPVVLQVKLFSVKLAEAQFWIFLIGLTGMVISFFQFDTYLLAVFASLVSIAMLIFIFNITASMTKVKEWNITGTYIAAALVYLFFTVVAGIMMAINLYHPYFKTNHLEYLKLHAHLAFVGWVSMVIMGVSYKLIPMFSLSHGFSLKPAKWVFGFINAGLILLTIEYHLPERTIMLPVGALFIAAGNLVFFYQVYLIMKNRVRKNLDVGLTYSMLSFGIMIIVTLLGLFLVLENLLKPVYFEKLSLIYGYLILFGYFSLIIVGQMYKIVPFLVWFHKFSAKVGLEPVPSLKDMYNEKLARFEFIMMNTAIAGTVAAIAYANKDLMYTFTGLMFLSSLLFLKNMSSIFLTKGAKNGN